MQVARVQHAILYQQRSDILLQREARNFLDELIFVALIEKPVQVNDKFIEAAITGQYFLEENVLVLLEKVDWVVIHPNLLCPLE